MKRGGVESHRLTIGNSIATGAVPQNAATRGLVHVLVRSSLCCFLVLFIVDGLDSIQFIPPT